jgi:hypothetical protein
MEMNYSKIVRGMGVLVFGIAGLSLAGCAESLPEGMAESEAIVEGDTMEAEEAIGAECAAATQTATFVGFIPPTTSPQTYNKTHCYKAVVYDVTNYSPDYVPNGWTSGGGIYIEYADAPVATASACNQLWVRADLFEFYAPTGQWIWKGTQEDVGQWYSASPSHAAYCDEPWVGFDPADFYVGKTYRVAATARTSESSSAPTRKVHVMSMETYHIE